MNFDSEPERGYLLLLFTLWLSPASYVVSLKTLVYQCPMEDSSETFENTHSYEEKENDDIQANMDLT